MTIRSSSHVAAQQTGYDLAEGFIAHIKTWATRCKSPMHTRPALYHAAFKLALATTAGHVCLPLSALIRDTSREDPACPDDPHTLRDLLLDSGIALSHLAITPRASHPLVIDADDRLYLRRYFDLEHRLAVALSRFLQPSGTWCDRTDSDLSTALFNNLTSHTHDEQKQAVALAMLRPLTLISGGPGTGKTTTVATLLACLLTQRPDLRIALAAPTGKAAARMLEALKQRSLHFSPSLQSCLPQEAYTIHRLLGASQARGKFRHHAANPLAVDVVVVDEASMLDLSLATHLIEAIPAGARLIMLGDRDQLAAVEAGAVFSELTANCAYTPETSDALSRLTGTSFSPLPALFGDHPPLTDSVIWLQKSHRFSPHSGIGKLAAAIRNNQPEQAIQLLHHAEDDSILWLNDDSESLSHASRRAAEAGYQPYLQALQDNSAPPEHLFRIFSQFRVLTAVREGPRGLNALNRFLSHFIRSHQTGTPGHYPPAPWYRGRAVIILENAPLLGLYNGDVGLCLPDLNGQPVIHFPDTTTSAEQTRTIHPARLPQYDDAFALTVHKSQGSEFDHVLFILPSIPSPILSRELLYTGITRAAQSLTLSGTAAQFLQGCIRPTQRYSGLYSRLREVISQTTI